MKLLAKLLEIRKSVEYLKKTERGNQGAMYVDPAVLIKKIRDRMDEHKIILVPEFVGTPAVDQIDSPTKNNPSAKGFMIKSRFQFTWMDTESEDKLPVSWFITGKHGTDPAMAEGSALTYNERYFLLKFFQIPTAKDDPEYFQRKTAEPEPPKTIQMGEENINWLIGFCKRHSLTQKDDKEAFQQHYGFNPYETTADQFGPIKAKIQEDYNEAD